MYEKKRLSKQQLLEKQKLDEKKINRTMLIGFSILFLCSMSILTFYSYQYDTRQGLPGAKWYGMAN